MLARRLHDLEWFLYNVPFYPFLGAAYPILLLYSDNLSEVRLSEVIGPVIVVTIATALGYLLLAKLTRSVHVAALITAGLLVAILGFGRISELIDSVWSGSARTLAVAVLAAVVVLAVLAWFGRARLKSVTAAINVASVVLVVLVLLPIGSHTFDEWGRPGAEPLEVTSLSLPEGIAAGRDIYHLVFDRYGSSEAFELAYDFSNDDFTDWLREQGFQVVEDARANYVRTTMSLASTFGMGLLDDVVERVGEDGGSYEPVVDRIQANPAAGLLQDIGYEHVHIGSWFPDTRTSQVADRVFFSGRAETFLTALYDLTIVPILLDGRVYAGPTHARSAQYQFDILDQLADEPGPKYVFAHILLPHPPFVFLEDGTVDRARANMQTQLAYTNDRIRGLLEPLLELPEDERPIIILQADEGPYPQRHREDLDGFMWADATDDELRTKFGILMAFMLPGAEGTVPVPESMSLVNTFPEVYRRYFGFDGADRPDRSFTSQHDSPYDMIDITRRLDASAPVAAQQVRAAEPPGEE